MTGWYDGWREAKKRLTDKPDDEFLQNLVNNLHELALADYLEMFSDDGRSVDSESIAEFLAGLDELRAPSKAELDDFKAQLMANALKALDKMRGLNWTGEHTYGQALDDAEKVLDKVWRDEPFPNLDRFRCPSEYRRKSGVGNRVIRCKLQLPHDGNHSWADEGPDGNLIGPVRWTDEQALNPPKDNDAPNRCTSMWNSHRCALPALHEGPHNDVDDDSVPIGSKVSWPDNYATGTNPDPINRPTAEQSDGACGAKLSATGGPCIRPKPHGGMHRDAEGGRWSKDVETVSEALARTWCGESAPHFSHGDCHGVS